MEEIFKNLNHQTLDNKKSFIQELFPSAYWIKNSQEDLLENEQEILEEEVVPEVIVDNEIAESTGPVDIALENFPQIDFSALGHQITNCHGCFHSESVKRIKKVIDYSEMLNDRKEIKILFVLDYPRIADEKSRSLVEQQEELLDKMIIAMKLQKSEYFKSYSIKCSLLENDIQGFDPKYSKCLNYLHHEIFYLKPQVVITLGAIPTKFFLGQDVRLSIVHGNFYSKTIGEKNKTHKFELVPIFHPELLVINPGMKRTTWNDLQKVMTYLGKTL